MDHIDCLLDYDVKYYKCDRISVTPAQGGIDVFVTYCPDNLKFVSDNPSSGKLPDIIVILNVVCFVGAVTVPHIKCMLRDSMKNVKIDRMAEAYLSCDARDILDVVLNKIGDEIYVLDKIDM